MFEEGDGLPQGLVIEIQTAAINPNVDVAALLRMAKVAAVKIGQTDFVAWLDSEIDGYNCSYDELPDYRKTHGILKVQNPFHGLIPFIIRNARTEELVTRTPTFQGISSLQTLIRNSRKSDVLTYQMQPEHRNLLMDMMEVQLEPVLLVSSSQIEIILNRVISMVLNWSLELEQAGILGEGMSFTMKEKEIAAPITQNFFGNNIGTVGSIKGQAKVQNNQTSSHSSLDREALANFLSETRRAKDLLPDTIKREIANSLDEIENAESDLSKRQSILSMKTILESASGGVAAQGILALIATILG